MDIISEGQGEGLFETRHAKNHRAENDGNVEWKARQGTGEEIDFGDGDGGDGHWHGRAENSHKP